MRIGPLRPRLGAAGFRLTLPLIEHYYRRRSIFRSISRFALKRFAALRAKLDRGETVYLAGIGAGTHNSGVALVEVTRQAGPKVICNNEEERFSGEKHSTQFPQMAIDALLRTMNGMGLGPERIDAWLGAFDYPAMDATLIRTVLEEAPASFAMLRRLSATPALYPLHLGQTASTAQRLGHQLGRSEPVPVIAIPHHDNHAWFSFAGSPMARSSRPVVVAVLDGHGDLGAISIYLCDRGRMHRLRSNDSVFDSLGIFYSVISSSQGGWTWLSSEGRYMGATAYGDNSRQTNRFYAPMRQLFSLQPEGQVYLNRALANWQRDAFHAPYTPDLVRILGEPIALKDMWNPDKVLRVEDITRHYDLSPPTQERLDKAAATQMVFEDALIHILDHFIRKTGTEQLVLTGGVALNALANMHLLEHFDESYYRRHLGRRARLHLWVPPTPNDAGVPVGAAYMGAYLAGAGIGAPLDHAFYCGITPKAGEIHSALAAAPDIAWISIGDASEKTQRDAIADLMAYVTAHDGIIAVVQGCAETGPRALGHRSILANPCNPRTRDALNARVKYREAIRPLAPMMTLEAAQRWFELSDGASDASYNAYNYMVLTARAKTDARARIPAVIHADGSGRLQIVRAHTDPLSYAYLKALGRRIGVEVAVNTSFNVAGPIAQTADQAIATLRRSKGMDAVLLFAEEGPVFAAWRQPLPSEKVQRFREWFDAWKAETTGSAGERMPPFTTVGQPERATE